MSEIVEKMRQEIIRRSDLFQEQTKGTKDEYNLYKDHIQYVYHYVLSLSHDKNVDREVLEISSLLHDISMTDRDLDRSKHNEYSANIAEELLRNNNYPLDKINLIKKCIINHSHNRKEFRTTMEEQILVDADGLSHFDSIPSLYSLAHTVMELNDIDALSFIQDKLTNDFNEISDDAKSIVTDIYCAVMHAKIIHDFDNFINISENTRVI